MRRILFDINIFLDILKKRAGWLESSKLVGMVKVNQLQGVISTFTVPIIYFHTLRVAREKEARKIAERMTKGFVQVSLTERIIAKALASTMPDFEDNIQFFTAKEAEVDYILTRNVKHYPQTEIPVLTPEELLAKKGVWASR